MAIDETKRRSKSMVVSNRMSSVTTDDTKTKMTNVPERMGFLLARKRRIERWASEDRRSSISTATTTTTTSSISAALGSVSAQKRSDSLYSQTGRMLHMKLLQLSEQRQKTIEQRNFDQKLFANKQAIKYKDNTSIVRTLNYVRKCCKYADTNHDAKDNIDPKMFLEENSSSKRSRSRSPSASPQTMTKRNLSTNARVQTSASLAETFLKHNKKHLESYRSSPINRKLTASKTLSDTRTVTNSSEITTDDDSQKRHVQFRINPDGTQRNSQSACLIRKSSSSDGNKSTLNDKESSVVSYDNRTSISAPLIRTISPTSDQITEPIKSSSSKKRSLTRISSTKSAFQEFRVHPERFLSRSNRYLPLLRQQAVNFESRESYNKQQKDRTDSTRKQRTHLSPPISRLSDGSDLAYDDAKSFLSDDNDGGRSTSHSPLPVWIEQPRKTNKKIRASNKIDMMESAVEDTSEYSMTLARLRNREYAHLNELVHSNLINEIVEPFSAIKTDENEPIEAKQQNVYNYKQQSTTSTNDQSTSKSTKLRQLGEILHSIDSLRCSDAIDRRARRQVDLEKNRAKLGILIF